jgi:LCP family protein required for cell wall assembly
MMGPSHGEGEIMTDEEVPGEGWWPPRGRRLVALIAALVVLVGGGGFTAYRLLSDRYEIPSAALFDESPSPSGTGSPSASPSPSALPGADIKGPLNILIAGIDTRSYVPGWRPNADAIMILHVSAGLDKGYLFSLPRDLVVDIPAFKKAGFGGAHTKINASTSYGSRVPGSSKVNTAQGFQLLALAVSKYTGIKRFDAGAVLNFGGMKRLVDALGGVDIYIDQRVASIHMRPDGKPRTNAGPHGTGPQMIYRVGQMHLNGWQALDYARQRYIAGADYARQRHQRQLIKAIIKKAFSRKLATDLVAFDRTLRALGGTVIFDGRGHGARDLASALRGLGAERLTLVGLPGSSVYSGGSYRGERLNNPLARNFFAAVIADKVDPFLAAHPALVGKEP